MVFRHDSRVSLSRRDQALLVTYQVLSAGMKSVGVNTDVEALIDPNRVVELLRELDRLVLSSVRVLFRTYLRSTNMRTCQKRDAGIR